MFAGRRIRTSAGSLPVGGAAVVVLAVALVAVAFGRVPVPRVGRSGLLLIAAPVGLTLWIGVTMSWSIVADRSWDAFNKAVAYCAFLGLGVVLAALGRRFGARLAACDALARARRDSRVGAPREGRSRARPRGRPRRATA